MSLRPTAVTEPRAASTARQALRRMTSGVTVLTIVADGLRHGTTVSAVITMSRDPLILGACLRPTSTFAAMIRRAGLFSVNVLTTDQEPVARRFADPAREPGDGQFAAVRWTTDELTGAPLIDGCLAHIACRAMGWQRVGDHDLLLAHVLDGTTGPGVPLVSFAGGLHPATPAMPGPSMASPAHPPTVTIHSKE